jgi:hypothetical protein
MCLRVGRARDRLRYMVWTGDFRLKVGACVITCKILELVTEPRAYLSLKESGA